VSGVAQDGPVYRGGVRDGEELVRWPIQNEDLAKKVLLGVVTA
jgi:hypothetical protein